MKRAQSGCISDCMLKRLQNGGYNAFGGRVFSEGLSCGCPGAGGKGFGSETEAYRGEADTACHAHKGRTKRTEVLYQEAGRIYVYLCYGMHWLLNFVTGEKEQPQAVLIRACEEADGPGKLTKKLAVDGHFNNTSVFEQTELWVEDDRTQVKIVTDTRVGIGYASREDQERLWRFKACRRQ